jgi:hypothetical protein
MRCRGEKERFCQNKPIYFIKFAKYARLRNFRRPEARRTLLRNGFTIHQKFGFQGGISFDNADGTGKNKFARNDVLRSAQKTKRNG